MGSSDTRRVILALSAAWAGWISFLVFAYLSGHWGIRRHHLESALFFTVAAVLALSWFSRRFPIPLNATPRSRRWLILCGAGSLCGIAVLSQSIRLGLFSDDYVLLDLARRGDYLGSPEFARPFPLLLWQILLAAGAGAPELHAVNVALHVFNAALVWKLSLALRYTDNTAAAAAGLFATFPANVEAVLWVSGIHDVLLTTLTLTTCLVALNEKQKLRWIVLTVLSVAAIATKETGIALPALLLIVLSSRPESGTWASRFRIWLPVAVASTFALGVRLLVRAPEGNLLVESRYQIKELLVRPFAYLTVPAHSEVAAAAPVLFAAMSAVVILALFRSALIEPSLRRWGHVLWVLAAVVPLQRYFYVSEHLEGARYLYLPSVGWALLLADLFTALGNSRARVVGGRVIVTVVLGVQLWLLFLNLKPWIDAAHLRDRLLTAAQHQLAASQCRSAFFGGVPDSLEGAQVFRNGFHAALGVADEDARTARRDGCSFRWNGTAFAAD